MIIVKLPNYSSSYFLDDCLKWAKKNCPSFEKRTIETPRGEEYPMPMFITRYDTLCYHFSQEQDAILFTLRWS